MNVRPEMLREVKSRKIWNAEYPDDPGLRSDTVSRHPSIMPLNASSKSISVFQSALNTSDTLMVIQRDSPKPPRNLWQVFCQGCSHGLSNPCVTPYLGKPLSKPVWKSYYDVQQLALTVGSAMLLPFRDVQLYTETGDPIFESKVPPAESEVKRMCIAPLTELPRQDRPRHSPVSKISAESSAANLLQQLSSVLTRERCGDPAALKASPTSKFQCPTGLDFTTWRAIGLFTDCEERFFCFSIMLGASAYGVSVVCLGSDLSHEDVWNIARNTNLTSLFGSAKKIESYLTFLLAKAEGVPCDSPASPVRSLAACVPFGTISLQTKVNASTTLKIRVLPWPSFLDHSKHQLQTPTPTSADRPAVILFTRRIVRPPFHENAALNPREKVTGRVVTHFSLVASIAALKYCLSSDQKDLQLKKGGRRFSIDSAAVHYSYLPQGSPLDLTLTFLTLSEGGRIAFCNLNETEANCLVNNSHDDDSPWQTFFKDIHIMKPTFLVGYPLLALGIWREMCVQAKSLKSSSFNSYLKSRLPLPAGSRIKRSWTDSMKLRGAAKVIPSSIKFLWFSFGVERDLAQSIQIVTGPKVAIASFFGDERCNGICLMDFQLPCFTQSNGFTVLLPNFALIHSQPRISVPLKLRGPSTNCACWSLEEGSNPIVWEADNDGWLDMYVSRTVDPSLSLVQVGDEQSGLLCPRILQCPLIAGLKSYSSSEVTVVISERVLKLLKEQWKSSKTPLSLPAEIQRELGLVGSPSVPSVNIEFANPTTTTTLHP